MTIDTDDFDPVDVDVEVAEALEKHMAQLRDWKHTGRTARQPLLIVFDPGYPGNSR